MSKSQQCEGCAFGPACGDTSSQVFNGFRGEVSALAGTPFWCHHSQSGQEYEWRGLDGLIDFLALPAAEKKICAGWRARVAELAERGHFKMPDGLRLYQKQLGYDAYTVLEKWISAKEGTPEKAQLKERLDDVVHAMKDAGPL